MSKAGPLFEYSDATYERLLQSVQAHDIGVAQSSRGLTFRRGSAEVSGDIESIPGAIYLGCRHGLNPFRWRREMRLLAAIETALADAGIARMLWTDRPGC